MIRRRAFLQSLLTLLMLPWRRFAFASGEADYVRLREAVEVPLETLNGAWQPVGFTAWLEDPAEMAVDKALKGILVRARNELKAYCIYCPHEVCQVELKNDASNVKLDEPRELDHPMFVCPCHFSVFDPLRDGEQISGPAWRGLYRFQVEQQGETVRIISVEKAVLTLYG